MTTGITRDETLAQQIINLLFCKIYDEINTPLAEIVDFRLLVLAKHPRLYKSASYDCLKTKLNANMTMCLTSLTS